jgi:nucleoside-diphosphate-sugar epimerase
VNESVTAQNAHSILLIGGAGLIGSSLSIELARSGHKVVVLDDLSVNNLESEWDLARPGVNRALYEEICRWRLQRMADAGVEHVHSNARSLNAVQETAESSAVNVIVNLAAVSHASRSNADPQRAFENGDEVLQVALEVARRQGVDRFVYMSSSMVIGDFPADVVDETVSCNPMSIYGALKLGGEVLVRAYSRVYGIDHTIVRPAAAYGPGCIGRRFIQASIESALGGQPISVPADGNEVVDFSYIDDVVQGLQRVIESPQAANETFNMTAGNARSLAEVAESIQQLVPGTQIVSRPRSALVPRRGTLAVDKARRVIGYEPQVSLHDGIARYIDWYREFTAGRPELLTIEESVIND